eukprot:3940436-Rhodomonas_salina.2
MEHSKTIFATLTNSNSSSVPNSVSISITCNTGGIPHFGDGFGDFGRAFSLRFQSELVTVTTFRALCGEKPSVSSCARNSRRNQRQETAVLVQTVRGSCAFAFDSTTKPPPKVTATALKLTKTTRTRSSPPSLLLSLLLFLSLDSLPLRFLASGYTRSAVWP